MKMTINEALNTLGIKQNCGTKETIKTSYRRLASKYHPDRNPDGLVMMQKINVAYAFLSGKQDIHLYSVKPTKQTKSKSAKPAKAKIKATKVSIKIGEMEVMRKNRITSVTGKTYPFRGVLKENKFKWSPDNRYWWRKGYCAIEIALESALQATYSA